MPDPIFDRYFIDTRTLGGLIKASDLYGDQRFKDIFFNFNVFGEAFQLALTQPYLVPALREAMPHEVLDMAYEISRECYIQFAFVGAGAAVGALIGGLGGTVTLPLAGTVAGAGAGASLRAGIAGWMMFGIGLPGMIGAAKYLSDQCAGELQAGMDAAMKGDKETAARQIAKFFAQVLAYIIPVIIIALLCKGAKVATGRFAGLGSVRQWTASIKWLEISDMKLASKALGMTEEEIKALGEMSRGGILVIRGCNPLRLKYIQNGYHAKPVYIKHHTSKSGEFQGQVCTTYQTGWAELASKGYRITEIPGGKFGLRNLYQIQHPTNYDAPMNGHYLPLFMNDSNLPEYRILHLDGKPFIGDMDRVASAEFDSRTGLLKPPKYANDDSREIAFMNEQMRRLVTHQVNYNVFQHGNACMHLVEDKAHPGALMPGWPHRDPATQRFDFDRNEPLLVAIHGQRFVLNWEQFGAFCRMFEELDGLFPW